MAIVISNEYDHVDIVNGSNTNRHYIKDATARRAIDGYIKSYNSQSFSGEYTLDGMDFQNGNLNPSTGEFQTGLNYRIASRRSIVFNQRVEFGIADGFRVLVDMKNGDAWAGAWHTGSFHFNENAETKLIIARVTEDTSEVADIQAFLSAITLEKTYAQITRDMAIGNANRLYDFLETLGSLKPLSGTESNGFWNTSNGAFASSDKFKTITVPASEIGYGYYSGIVYSTTIVSGVVFLGASNNIIGKKFNGSSSGTQTLTDEYIGEIPAGTVNVAFCGYIGSGATVEAKDLTIDSIYTVKNIVITGDSIETESAGRWAQKLNAMLKFKTYTNCAVGGTCISAVGDNYISSDARINAMPETADIILVGGGTNDWGNNVAIGDLSDTSLSDNTNFAGAVYSMITKLQTKYPNAQIVFMSNPNTCSPNRHNFDDQTGWKNNRGLTASDYANMMESVCRFASIPYIDVNHLCSINRLNFTSFLLQETNYYNDTVYMHPNYSGAKRMLQVIYRWFINNDPIS